MSTANFRDMEYGMPMVCGGFTEYDEETGDYFYDEWESREAERLAEEFTDSLVFHNVTIEGGYYDGFQFWIEEKYSGQFDLDKDSEYCIDNEDAHYYFDMCRSKAIRAADAEKRKIAKWLEKVAAENGYSILVVTARFSNGETIYAPRTERTEMLAAVAA